MRYYPAWRNVCRRQRLNRQRGAYGLSCCLAGQDTRPNLLEKIGSMSYTEGLRDTRQRPRQRKGDNNMIRITMQNGKTIDIELDPKAAPITCENFEKLVKQGFYNGLTFHRVIPGFMIQGGCPEGTGMGGPGWHIKGEFLQNGVVNPIKHIRGVISMARAMDPNSAGSQFFIMHQDAPHLDGGYAAFGHVVSGMDVVDEIAAVSTDWNDKPRTPVVMEKVEII